MFKKIVYSNMDITSPVCAQRVAGGWSRLARLGRQIMNSDMVSVVTIHCINSTLVGTVDAARLQQAWPPPSVCCTE